MTSRFTYVGSVYLFLIVDNKILLQRRCNTGFEDGNYGVPSGHLDGNETAREGCVREILEEISINIEPNELTVSHVMHRKSYKDERIDFFMTATSFAGEIVNNEPDKCDDLRWFSLDDLPSSMIEYVKVALQNSLSGVTYSEYGW